MKRFALSILLSLLCVPCFCHAADTLKDSPAPAEIFKKCVELRSAGRIREMSVFMLPKDKKDFIAALDMVDAAKAKDIKKIISLQLSLNNIEPDEKYMELQVAQIRAASGKEALFKMITDAFEKAYPPVKKDVANIQEVITGDKASVSAVLTLENGTKRADSLHFTKKDGRWYIAHPPEQEKDAPAEKK